MGGGGTSNVNVYQTPASNAVVVGAAAATERVGQGRGPNRVLSEGIGTATAALFSSTSLSKSAQISAVINRHISALVNSPTGRVADTPAPNGPVNGAANIREGIAIISGQRAGQ